MQELLSILRALGEQTRLRTVIVLEDYELTVSELVEIIQQSQPSMSRHLRLLCEAGVLQRQQEGSHAFFRITDNITIRKLIESCHPLIDFDEAIVAEDQKRLLEINIRNAQIAAKYFEQNAAEWDKLRVFMVPDSDIENRMLELISPYQPKFYIDFGTGTGRMLELFSSITDKSLGIDISKEMLKVARHNLTKKKLQNCRLLHADITDINHEQVNADLITIHQVLHYLDQPEQTLRIAANLLNPGGILVVVDFLPHEFEFLRDDHAHRRLGFQPQAMQKWFQLAGLKMIHFESFSNTALGAENLSIGLWLAQK